MLRLSKELQDEYLIDKETQSVVPKQKSYKFESEKYGSVEVPSDRIILMAFTDDSDEEIVTSIFKKIKYNYLQTLKDKYKIEFNQEEVIQAPSYENYYHGYVRIPVKGSNVVGDGEVHENSLGDFYIYAWTTMYQRAESRAILKELGLYDNGFLSESESLVDIKGKKKVSVSYDDLPPKQLGKASNDNSVSLEDDEPEEEQLQETDEDAEFLFRSIELLSSLVGEVFLDVDEQLPDIFAQEHVDIDYDGQILTELNKKQLVVVLDYYETEKFESDESLFRALKGVVDEYRTEQGWRLPEFREKVAEELDCDPKTVPQKLRIQDWYILIDKWNLWKS